MSSLSQEPQLQTSSSSQQQPGPSSSQSDSASSSTASPAAGRGRSLNYRNLEESDEIDRLRAKGDRDAAEKLLQRQREKLYVGDAVAGVLGYDSEQWRPPTATGLHPDVELEAFARKYAKLMAGKEKIYKEEGLDSVNDLRRKMVQTYKGRHDASVTGDPAESMPIEWDPNELADARFKIAKIHNRIRKEVDPNFNAYNDPFLGVLSQSMTEGNLATSGAQPMHGGIGGVVGEAIGDLTLAPVRGILDAGFEFGYGLASLGNRVIQGLSGGQLGVHVQEPTHGVVDEDGHLWTNAGKVSGFGHMAAMAQAMVYGQVTEDVAQLGDTIALKDAQRHGLERFAHSVAYGVGSFAGMGIGAGPLTTLARRGLTWLGSAGRGLHALRSQKILDLASAAVGMGGYEAIAKGEADGYGKAGLHGMALGILGAGLGLMGRKTEAFLEQKSVPALFARAISGAAEGAGFSVPTQEMWDLIRDPSKETWSRFAGQMAVNVTAMGLLKSFGTTPSEHLLAPETAPRTKLPAAPEAQRAAAAELRTAETRAREVGSPRQSYRVEGKEGRVLPVIEHKGGVAEGFVTSKGEVAEAPAGESVAKALEEGLPSRYREEQELTHEEAIQRKQVERRKGQRGHDPLEDPEFGSFPEEVKSKLLATKDVGERMKIWNESAEQVLRPELDALKAKVAKEGRGASLDDMRKLTLRAMGTPLEKEVRNLTHGEPVTKEQRAFKVPDPASREAKYYKEQLEQRDKKTREQERFEEIGRKLSGAEEAMKTPELRKPAFEAKQRARQEIAVETRGPKSAERLAEEREDLHHEIVTNRSFPARRGIEEVEGTAPVRASDIVLAAQGVHEGHPIKFAYHTKRVHHWARGYYDSLSKEVRSQIPLDLNNLAHEFPHAIQDQTIGLKWKPAKGPVRDELLEIGRPLYNENWPLWQRIKEGWAEFWARDLLGDPELESKFPNAHRWLKAWISAPEQADVLKQYDYVKGLFQRERDQGAVNRRRMTLHMQGDKPSPEQRALWGSKWSQVKRVMDRVTDDNARIRHSMQRHGFKVGDLPVDADPYRMATINRMRGPGVADTFLYKATLGVGGKRTGEGFKQAIEQIKDDELADWVGYTVSRLSLELQDKGITTDLPRETDLAVVARLGNPRFENATQRAKEFMDRLIDYAALHGAVTEVSSHYIKESTTVYLPLFRMLIAPRMVGKPPRGTAERGSGVGHREGSTREIVDPIQSMTEVVQSVVSKAHKAQVMKSLYTLSVIEPNGGFVTEVPRDVRPIQLNVDELRAALQKIGVETKAADGLRESDLASILTLFETTGKPAGHEGIVVHTPSYSQEEIDYYRSTYGDRVGNKLEKVNGKAKWLEVDPELFEGLMNIDAENAMNIPRALSMTTRLMKLGYTGIKAPFTALNFVKDTILLPMFSSTKRVTRFIPIVGGIVESVAGARAQFKGRIPLLKGDVDPIAQILQDAGVRGSTLMQEATLIGKPAYADLITRTLPEQGKYLLMHPARAALKGLDILEKGFGAAESFARTNEGRILYQRAIDAGKTEEQAYLEGLEAFQEITQNFIKTGAQVRALSRVLPYFSSKIGGYRRLGRVVLGYEGKEAQLRAIGQGLLNISSLGIISYLLFGHEDWHKDRPQWRKNNFWSLRFGDVVMDLPKPFEFGTLFSNPVEWALGKIAGTDKDTVWEMVGGMLMNELRSFSMLPSLIGPSVEVAANYSFFTGRSIVPQWMEDRLAPEKREQVYTTWIAKQIGHAIGVSPIKVEYLMSAHTGGLAIRVARTADELFGLREDLKRHDVSSTQEELAAIPFLGAFFGQHAHEQSAAVQRLYELHAELNREKAPAHEALRLEIGRAKRQLSEIFKAQREGRLSREEADEKAYKIAHPLVERYDRIK